MNKHKRRFVADSAFVLDTLNGQRYFGRRVFDIDGAEFDEVNLSPSDRSQIFAELGLEGCVAVLQKAFDAQDKPYNARAVVDSLVKANFTKKNRYGIKDREQISKKKGLTPKEVIDFIYGPPPRKKSDDEIKQ